jgi:hypothetical protein
MRVESGRGHEHDEEPGAGKRKRQMVKEKAAALTAVRSQRPHR